jgi:transposase
MCNTLSMDLRERFARLMAAGKSAAAAGRILLVSPATAARWGKKVRDGERLEPGRRGRRTGWGKLAPHMDFFAELIEQDPDITLVELRDALETAEGVVAHISSIGAAIAKQGYRYKKRPYRRGARQARGPKGAAVLDQRTPPLHA